MSVAPAANAVTRPFASMVATDGVLLVQETVRPEITSPLCARTVAVHVVLDPTCSVVTAALISRLLTTVGGLGTVDGASDPPQAHMSVMSAA